MAGKLTAVQLRQIKPTEKEQNLCDGEGLYFRVLPIDKGGGTSFYYRYEVNGKSRRISCGRYPTITLSEARQIRDQTRLQVSRGVDVAQVRREERRNRIAAHAEAALEQTVVELFEDWQALYLKLHRKDGGASVRWGFMKDIAPVIGKLKAKEVNRRHIGITLDRVVARGTKRTANHLLSVLKQMFKWAYVRGKVDIDPTYGYTKKDVGGRDMPRERNLSFDEVRELFSKLPESGLSEQMQAAVRLILATGVRVGELSKARWEDVDLDQGVWVIPEYNAKNQRRFVIPLSAYAMTQVRLLHRLRADDYLLTSSRYGRVYCEKAVTRLIRDRNRATPLKGRTPLAGTLRLAEGTWTPHDLRRTMASRMGDIGIAPHIIERCLNHIPQGIVAVYQRQHYEEELAEAFRRWGQQLHELEHGEETANTMANVVAFRRR